MPLRELELLRAEKSRRIHRLEKGFLQLRKQKGIAPKAARLQKRRLHGNVFSGFFQSAFNRAYAVPDRKSEIPKTGNKALDSLKRCFVRLLGHQHHDVEIGVGEKLFATVAAKRQERHLGT